MLMNSLSILIIIFSLPLFIQGFEQHRSYVHVPTRRTWDDAQSYCRQHHTDLAIFEDKAEYDALQNPCASGNFCWIGLRTDSGNPDIWKWTNGKEVNFTSWYKTQPNERNLHCVKMHRKLWYDYVCSHIYESVCYDNLVLVEEEKTWEEALEHCRTLQTDPTSSNTHFSHHYDLPHMHAEKDNLYAKTLIQKAQTQEVWIGLRFLAGHWLWVNGFPLEDQLKKRLSVCPAPKMHCGTMSKTGGTFSERDCSEKRNFFCLLRK
ncbi:macrophage mannose receptor 1-like [Notolabrus celidotus]|uniref:macrophage mannose receptor 1-like n=1 Tax=Notolabrus celidotus TaxID=1203425 RepID=UPI001490302C|nr:macrophage mannose receptor 1-like [Notolabrus celidotus]